MTIYFVAGEVSADNHGAALMRSLRVLDPELKFIGRGGPQMQQVAGAQFNNWIGDAAVLGLWEVLRRYGYFREQFRQTLNEIQESKPDAVVLIDYPGFNLRLARALRKAIATPENNLLHQPAGLGVEPWTHKKNGALHRSCALHFSVRDRSLRRIRAPSHICRSSDDRKA